MPLSPRGVALVLTVGTLLGACGEVENLVLPIRPEQAAFPAVQDALIIAGCSGRGSGCHTALTGDLQISPPPKSPAVLEEEYIQTKRFTAARCVNSLLQYIGPQQY